MHEHVEPDCKTVWPGAIVFQQPADRAFIDLIATESTQPVQHNQGKT